MSEDRNNGIGDSAVSDAYRDVATERAPASLNEAVLHNAAAHASKGYAHSMMWMRPLAWAATVVLSLAIVVQVVLPTASDVERPAVSSSPQAVAADLPGDADLGMAEAIGNREQTAEDDDPLKRLRDQEVREESKIEEFELPAVAAEADAVAATEDFADMDERLDVGGLVEQEEVMVQAARVPQQEPQDFEAATLRNEAIIQDVSDMAAARVVQPDDYNAPSGLTASPALSAPSEHSVCEPEDIESADSWAECITRLEDGGRAEEALRERTMLTEAFPDFEWPAE